MKVLIGLSTTKFSLTWSPSLVKRWHGALNVFSTTLTLTNFPGCLSTSGRCRRWGFTHTTTTVLSHRFRRFSAAPTSLVWLTYLWWARRVNTRDLWISIKALRWGVAKSIIVVTYLFLLSSLITLICTRVAGFERLSFELIDSISMVLQSYSLYV